MPAAPLSTPTRAGEAWHSYLTRAAATHGCTVHALAGHIGLTAGGRWPGYHGVLLEADLAGAVADNLALTPQDVHAMQLSDYDQRAFDLTGLTDPVGRARIGGTRRVAQQGWVFLAGSRYCPPCLVEDGTWQLSWRLPWTTTCPRHHTWLAHTCPACGGTPGLYTPLHGTAPSRANARPDGRRCDLPAPGPAGGVCGADLTATPPPPVSEAAAAASLEFQHVVDTGSGTVLGVEHPCLEVMRAWRSAIGIAAALGRVEATGWGRTHRSGAPPRDPHLMHDLVEAAAPVMRAATPEAAADVLHAWCLRAGIGAPHADTFSRAAPPVAALTPAITHLLRRSGRAHILLTRRTQSGQQPLGVLPWDVDDIPQLVWACALPPARQASRKPDVFMLRAVLALILARMHDGQDWATAGARLCIPAEKTRHWTRYCFSTRFPGLKDDLLTTAHELTGLLAHQPRRNRWADHPVLPPGYGLLPLRAAQDARCRRVDPTSAWCPCNLPARTT